MRSGRRLADPLLKEVSAMPIKLIFHIGIFKISIEIKLAHKRNRR